MTSSIVVWLFLAVINFAIYGDNVSLRRGPRSLAKTNAIHIPLRNIARSKTSLRVGRFNMQQVSTAAASHFHTRRTANGIVSAHQPAALRKNEGATDGHCGERVFTGEGWNKVVEALCCRVILMGRKKSDVESSRRSGIGGVVAGTRLG